MTGNAAAIEKQTYSVFQCTSIKGREKQLRVSHLLHTHAQTTFWTRSSVSYSLALILPSIPVTSVELKAMSSKSSGFTLWSAASSCLYISSSYLLKAGEIRQRGTGESSVMLLKCFYPVLLGKIMGKADRREQVGKVQDDRKCTDNCI